MSDAESSGERFHIFIFQRSWIPDPWVPSRWTAMRMWVRCILGRPPEILTGEIGRWEGVRYVEAPEDDPR